jgi:hypothetical protein
VKLSEIQVGAYYAVRFAAKSTADHDPEQWLASISQRWRIQDRARREETAALGAIRAAVDAVGVPYGKTRCGVRIVVEEELARLEPRSDGQDVLELDEAGRPIYDIRDVTLTVHASAILRPWDAQLLHAAAWRLERERHRSDRIDQELRQMLEGQ